MITNGIRRNKESHRRMDSSRKNTDSAGWFFGVETFLGHRERTWIGFLGLADVLDRKPDGANVLPPAVLLLSATPFVVIVVAVTVGVSTTIRSTAVSVSSIRSVAPSTILSTPVGPGVLFVITTVVPILVSFEGATTSITVILIGFPPIPVSSVFTIVTTTTAAATITTNTDGSITAIAVSVVPTVSGDTTTTAITTSTPSDTAL